MPRAAPIALLLLVAPAAALADDSTLQFRVAHSFTLDDAKARMQQMLDYWSTRYGVKSTWDGTVAVVRGNVMGIDISGEIVVEGKVVRGMARDPGTLFRSAARDYISRKLRKYLNPTYAEP